MRERVGLPSRMVGCQDDGGGSMGEREQREERLYHRRLGVVLEVDRSGLVGGWAPLVGSSVVTDRNCGEPTDLGLDSGAHIVLYPSFLHDSCAMCSSFFSHLHCFSSSL